MIAAIDTNIFIYALEDDGKLGEAARKLFKKVFEKKYQVFTSVLTIQEVLVAVYKAREKEKITTYLEFISANGLIIVVDMDREIAIKAAELRANYNIKTADAIQLATALQAEATVFFTADKGLPQKVEDMDLHIIS